MKIPLTETSEYLNGKIEGLNKMKKMVLEIFDEHPNASKEEIKNYIKEIL